jgi:hypothetical protein
VLLNKKYNGCRLNAVIKKNRILKIIIILGASGSGIAGLALWQTEIGKFAWAIVSTTAVVFYSIKPVVGYSKDIKIYSKLVLQKTSLF